MGNGDLGFWWLFLFLVADLPLAGGHQQANAVSPESHTGHDKPLTVYREGDNERRACCPSGCCWKYRPLEFLFFFFPFILSVKTGNGRLEGKKSQLWVGNINGYYHKPTSKICFFSKAKNNIAM
jgi:hypothetical protein